MPRRMPAPLAFAVASAIAAASCVLPWPVKAQQVRRCITADGQQVYTDRQCVDIGATERTAAPTLPSGASIATRRQRWTCAGDVEELVYQLNNALLAADVNQVASVYHWTGMSTRNAYAVMDRLWALTRRQTVDVSTLYSNPPDPYWQGGVIEVPLHGEHDFPELPPPPQPRLLGIQVLQTAPRGGGTVRTVFGLARHYGCWWIRY